MNRTCRLFCLKKADKKALLVSIHTIANTLRLLLPAAAHGSRACGIFTERHPSGAIKFHARRSSRLTGKKQFCTAVSWKDSSYLLFL